MRRVMSDNLYYQHYLQRLGPNAAYSKRVPGECLRVWLRSCNAEVRRMDSIGDGEDIRKDTGVSTRYQHQVPEKRPPAFLTEVGQLIGDSPASHSPSYEREEFVAA